MPSGSTRLAARHGREIDEVGPLAGEDIDDDSGRVHRLITSSAASRAAGRPVWATSSTRRVGSVPSLIKRWAIAGSNQARRTPRAAAGCASRRNHRKYSTLPAGPGSRLTLAPATPNPSCAADSATPDTASARRSSRRTTPSAPTRPRPDLELWLDHQQQVAVGVDTPGQTGDHFAQRDEREVGHQEVDRPPDGLRVEFADVGRVVHDHPRIRGKFGRQLGSADVDGVDYAGTCVKKHLGESAGRCARVETPPAGDRQTEWCEVGQGTSQLVPPSGHERRPGHGRGDRRVGEDLGRRLGHRLAPHRDRARGDQGRGLFARAGESAPHQRHVEPFGRCGGVVHDPRRHPAAGGGWRSRASSIAAASCCCTSSYTSTWSATGSDSTSSSRSSAASTPG